MKIVELVLDEEGIANGIDAISIVENPAIEENFIALNSAQKIEFKAVDSEKKILMGPALVPNKPIYRRDGETEYYVYFSRKTIRQASELYFKRGNQQNATIEHEAKVQGTTLVESWLVEDKDKDKSALYGYDVPLGTWMVSMKIDNDDIWNDYVKEGKVKGFSIEGYFVDKAQVDQKEKLEQEMAEELLQELKAIASGTMLKSYSDYSEGIRNNAKRGIELNEKNGNKCATQTGKVRAQQIAQGKPLSVATIKRMYSYLSRAETYYDPSDTSACGTISYLLWGGKAALGWSRNKLRELDQLDLSSEVIDDTMAFIDGQPAYRSREDAEQIAQDLGCEGSHPHRLNGVTYYMPCKDHPVSLADVGPRGGIRKSPKAPKSGTPNKNPKGQGTAKGDASTGRGAKVSKADEATLQRKSDDFNKRYKEKLGYGVTIGKLKAVFQRGLGAFNTSHSPKVKNPSQWAFARVNAFLYLVRNGRPQNPKYTGDYDLLPAGHPKKPK